MAVESENGLERLDDALPSAEQVLFRVVRAESIQCLPVEDAVLNEHDGQCFMVREKLSKHQRKRHDDRRGRRDGPLARCARAALPIRRGHPGDSSHDRVSFEGRASREASPKTHSALR
jgi:hypothetical protein